MTEATPMVSSSSLSEAVPPPSSTKIMFIAWEHCRIPRILDILSTRLRKKFSSRVVESAFKEYAETCWADNEFDRVFRMEVEESSEENDDQGDHSVVFAEEESEENELPKLEKTFL